MLQIFLILIPLVFVCKMVSAVCKFQDERREFIRNSTEGAASLRRELAFRQEQLRRRADSFSTHWERESCKSSAICAKASLSVPFSKIR